MGPRQPAAPRRDWPAYLAGFHAEQAGITEDVLELALDAAGRTPYDWLAEALLAAQPPGAAAPRVLDLACGSAPMASRLRGCAYLGVDVSSAELQRARRLGQPVLRADATRLPVADAGVDAVVMSMALMLVPLPAVLREVRRVLRPGGFFVATVPSSRPLPARDRLRWARLLLALRQPGLRYPDDGALRGARAAFAAAGLTLHRDDTSAFACALATPDAAERLLRSLYLPDVAPERVEAGRRVVRRWAGTTITVPVRLLTASAGEPPAPSSRSS